MTALIPQFSCFNDLYIKIFPTMLRIGRSRIHHCYFPSLLPSCKQAFLGCTLLFGICDSHSSSHFPWFVCVWAITAARFVDQPR